MFSFFSEDFSKPKVVYTPVNAEYRFAQVPPCIYLNNALFMITGKNIKIICAIANSRAFIFYLRLLLSSEYAYGAGNLFEKLPIPRLADTTKIDTLVDKITETIDSDRKTLESHIDAFVYQLYGFTQVEIAFIEK